MFPLLFVGCATAPPVELPVVDVDAPDVWTTQAEAAEGPDLSWWNDFGDMGLNEVVRLTLERNYDLQAAAARLEQASADSRIAAADLYPTLQVGLNGSRRKQKTLLGASRHGPPERSAP